MKAAAGGPRLTQGPIGRSILSLALPMMFSMIALISYNLADTFFIGQLGTLELAAISFTFPIGFIVGSITMGFGIGTSSVASRLFGAEKRDEAARVTLHAILLGFLTGIVVLTIGVLTIDPVFRLLGADDTTLPIIQRYMRIYYFGGIFLVVPMMTNSVLRAAGDATTPAKIMSIAAVLNIVLDPILIFGLFGVPALGVEGAAIATVLANIGTMIASISIVYFREKLISFQGFDLHLIVDSWRRILHVGIPSMTSSLIAPMTTAFITYQVAQFGQEAVAGFGVASRMEGLSLLALMALSAATTPFVGQNYGARHFDRVQDGVNWCYRFSVFYGLTVAAILAVSATWIATAFTDNENAIATATMHMRIVPISYAVLGAAMVVNGAFNAIGKPMPAMWVSLTRTALVYAPLAFLFARLFGLVGVFAAACTANFIAGTLGYTWFRSVYRKQVSQEEATAAA
ncbi:MAG: MATE family efflux transporter [Gammaproteobacteria bacterium]|nr:MATE family efflux transporter [Gammaproteobacteria bacterium]